MGGMYDKAWTEEEVKEATDLYKGGMSIELIAIELDRPYNSVLRKLTRLGVRTSMHGAHHLGYKLWTDEETKQLVDLRDAGYTSKQIGEVLGRSYRSVNNKLADMKIKEKEKEKEKEATMINTEVKKQWKPDPKKFVIIDGEKLRKELEKRNLKQADVAREIGINGSTMSKSINEGYLQPYTMKLLTLCYDIKLEDILPNKKEEDPVVKETPEVTIDIRDQELQWDLFLKKLDAVVEDAVYRGMTRALNS